MGKQQGFTLLELLMVVIIIAILAAVALPQYIRASEKARSSEAIQWAGAIRASQNRYKAQSVNNVFADVLADLDAELPAAGKYFNPAAPTFSATSVSFPRVGGTYDTQVVGIDFATGDLCGDFQPLNLTVACP